MDEQFVKDNIIFMTVVGSQAYGTSLPESDIDRRGICILPDASYYAGIGMNMFEQKENWDDGSDTVVYDIRKALKLMADANPNMLDILFVPPNCWERTSNAWDRILEHKQAFLSKRARYTYTGYAFAQLKRIRTHRNYLLNPRWANKPERKEFGLPERKLISLDDNGAFEWLIARLLEDSIEDLSLSDATKEELRNVNYIGLVQSKGLDYDCADALKRLTNVQDEFVDIFMRERKYASAMREHKSYVNWKATRNSKRQGLEEKFGYDCKHAMHLVRLLRMGAEILRDGRVNVAREDRTELLEIRNGAWSFEKLESYAQDCQNEMADLYVTSSLPKEPDRCLIDNLCIDAVLRKIR